MFDEIEKAHPDVFNVFLQILDEGRLTDGQGKTVDFRNTVILMTSNIGGRMIHEFGQKVADQEELEGEVRQDLWDEEFESVRTAIGEELRERFRPEFLNRIDDIVIFRNLSRKQIKEIVEVQLVELRKRLDEKRMTISFSENALEKLAEKGYDPVFGARPLKRAIQKYIQNPLSTKLLEETFCEGDGIAVDCNGESDVFQFEKVKKG